MTWVILVQNKLEKAAVFPAIVRMQMARTGGIPAINNRTGHGGESGQGRKNEGAENIPLAQSITSSLPKLSAPKQAENDMKLPNLFASYSNIHVTDMVE